ncbi:MAG: ribokinase, partial [Neisseriaceae bacterium]|nr:ribokinase [Neisseriaceae bacterium]
GITMKVLVIGSINTDFVVESNILPELGETVFGQDFAMLSGGKGANQAVAASRLGASVAMIAAVGDDEMGRRETKLLKQ